MSARHRDFLRNLLQQDFQDLILLDDLAIKRLALPFGVCGELVDVAEFSGSIGGIPAFKEVHKIHVDPTQGLIRVEGG